MEQNSGSRLGAQPRPNSRRESDTRRGRRRKVYLGELTTTDVTFGSGELTCEIVDLSPSGMGVVANIPEGTARPMRGERVHVSYGTRGGKRFRSWGAVASCEEITIRGVPKLRIGIAFVAGGEQDLDNLVGERDHGKISSPQGYVPCAFCEDPFFFRERIHFQVEEFSAGGLALYVTGFHATLLPNVVLPLTVFLPMLGQYEIEVRVVNVTEETGSDEPNYQVEVEYLSKTDAFRQAVSEFLLLSRAAASVDILKEYGFPVEAIDRALSFRYANSAEDYEAIMRLRGEAMDRYDEFSRQILCTVGDKIIACARLVFTDGEPTRSELNEMAGDISPKLWVQKFIECSRFYCLPGFSAKDVYFAFLKHFVRITAESGARYLMTACSAKALRLYEKIGFRRLKPAAASDSAASGMVVVVLDVHRILTVNGLVDSVIWKKLYGDVSKHVGVSPNQSDEEQRLFWTRRASA